MGDALCVKMLARLHVYRFSSRSMIPHHSSAILMCEQSAITDPEIVSLCEEIIRTQEEEIAEMEEILRRY